jgi:hypothetical protein
MTLPALPSGLQPDDYDKIEAAVMETARGRWFLLEFSRRQRAEETERLIAAIGRLEKRAAGNAGDALAFGEKLQDFAWDLRERGLDENVCAELEAMAREAIGCEPEGSWSSVTPMDREPSGSQLIDAQVEAIPIEPPVDPRLAALSRLDQTPLSEKLALFG